MSHVVRARARLIVRVAVLPGIVALTCASSAQARMATPATIATLTGSAAHVFRGRCAAVAVGTIDVAGARLPVTTYTFRVSEHLKGGRGRTLRFRQIGAPGGGPRDLGRLAELPVYAAGTDYVLFLLPASRAGLTSPAGAAEGAFVVGDGHVLPARAAARAQAEGPSSRARPPASDLASSSYDDLRRAVRASLRR